jgi:nucleoside-diphosphate kinase
VERTLVLVKPDAVQRGLTGRILARFEEKGLQIVGGRFVQVEPARAVRLYEVHRGKGFYPSLLEFITKGPLFALVLEGPRAIQVVRTLLGATYGVDAAPGTIRGDFGMSRSYNLVHASDSPESAAREIPIFFEVRDLVSYEGRLRDWILHPEDRR